MSNPTDLDQQLFNKRVEAFNKDLVMMQQKYGLVIVPFIDMTPFGIVPNLKYMDKAQFDAAQAAAVVAKPVAKAVQ